MGGSQEGEEGSQLPAIPTQPGPGRQGQREGH